jgi:hypothetical protein
VLDSDPQLSEELEKLGMPRYKPENKTSSTRLLDDLAIALENPEAIANRDIFMGQVRGAWSLFEPDTGGPFPHKHRFSRCDTHINLNRAAAFRIFQIYNMLYAFSIPLFANNLMAHDASKHFHHMFKFLRGG